jgi:hypothetical protein
VRNINKVRAAVDAIPEPDWQRIDYPDGGEAQIAETTYGTRRMSSAAPAWSARRPSCSPTGGTSRFSPTAPKTSRCVEAEHRDHAVLEQVIADLKDQALAHFPSGHFYANGAWTVLAAIAHNLLRWTQLLGLPDTTVRAARTLRRRLLAIPGRLTSHARGWTLHLPARWPWHGDYITALNAIRALPAAT